MKVHLIPAGIIELENHDAGVERECVRRMTAALNAAVAAAPVVTGTYRDSLELVVQHTDRVRVRVQSTVPYAMKVEALHGTLQKALDAAGGA